jgi:short-subunit dehydrogenase involved in D-alanine esterification of teichoic acids
MTNQQKILKAKDNVDKAIDEMKEVNLSATVEYADTMVMLRETYEKIVSVSQSLSMLADKA